jgi:hypothetical protein
MVGQFDTIPYGIDVGIERLHKLIDLDGSGSPKHGAVPAGTPIPAGTLPVKWQKRLTFSL